MAHCEIFALARDQYVQYKRRHICSGFLPALLWVRGAFSVLALINRTDDMKTAKLDLVKCSFWQRVFLQSKVNGARYSGEELPGLTWNWPKDTYLQRRLRGGQIYREEKKAEWN